MKLKSKNSDINVQGFTLIELMIVISIVGILAAIIVSVLNIGHQRRRATNAVDTTKLEQISQGLEAFNVAEGYYPMPSGGVPTDAKLSQYVSKWPSNFVYIRDVDSIDFDIYFPIGDGTFMKYSSAWAKIDICGPTDIDVVGRCE